MKRLTIGLISLVGLLIATNVLADVKQKTVNVKLIVPQIITLDVTQPEAIIPGPEDYAMKFSQYQEVAKNTGSSAPNDEYGFADRADAIKVSIFTNARSGAKVYVHGLANPEQNKTLHVEDVYLTVMTEKTYVLKNNLEEATAVAKTQTGCPNATWLQLNNEAKELFGVGIATKAIRDWYLKLGIGNLARYTENADGYDMDITFTLLPIV